MEATEGEVERLIAAAKVVEYLEPVMSNDLLCKFPDNSGFGFNYSQSSIWSPLIPRGHLPVELGSPVTPKKLSFGVRHKLHSARKRISTSAVKIGLRVMQSSRRKKMSRKLKSKPLYFSPAKMKDGACIPVAAKGWNKVLKAASKHFKKKKRRDPMAHEKLSKPRS